MIFIEMRLAVVVLEVTSGSKVLSSTTQPGLKVPFSSSVLYDLWIAMGLFCDDRIVFTCLF